MDLEMIRIFQSTMEVCRSNEGLIASIDASKQAQKVVFEEDAVSSAEPRFAGTVTQVLSSKRSFEAAKPYARNRKKVCVLNFASFVTPGGGVTRGARAQEESLCRISTLYPLLTSETAAPFYQRHHELIEAQISTRRNNDDCIYTPGVRVICEDNAGCRLLPESEWYTVDVITCAAPDQRYCGSWTYQPDNAELYEVMQRRIERIYAIAAMHSADVLVMGAFGCGAFHNPPEVVARAFETVSRRYAHHFTTIEYAIYNRYGSSPNYQAFARIEGICIGNSEV